MTITIPMIHNIFAIVERTGKLSLMTILFLLIIIIAGNKKRDYDLKSSVFYNTDVLLITGSSKYHLPLKKSHSKFCMFQPVIIDPDRTSHRSIIAIKTSSVNMVN